MFLRRVAAAEEIGLLVEMREAPSIGMVLGRAEALAGDLDLDGLCAFGFPAVLLCDSLVQRLPLVIFCGKPVEEGLAFSGGKLFGLAALEQGEAAGAPPARACIYGCVWILSAI